MLYEKEFYIPGNRKRVPVRIYKEFSDGTALGWGPNKFDWWCVYLIESNVEGYPPRDLDYFEELLWLADRYGHQEVYEDFVVLYDAVVSKIPEECHIEVIDRLAEKYGHHKLAVSKLFTTLWMAMISEWNYPGTHLRHRIKRLGVYHMLIKGETPEYAKDFMKGYPWRKINEWCEEGEFSMDPSTAYASCYCIKCGKDIRSTDKSVFCSRCLGEWSLDPELDEPIPNGVCYFCGRPANVTAGRPSCFSCYQKAHYLNELKSAGMKKMV